LHPRRAFASSAAGAPGDDATPSTPYINVALNSASVCRWLPGSIDWARAADEDRRSPMAGRRGATLPISPSCVRVRARAR
jgi:hypothetical protein